jgi:hypothetical protein
VRPARPRHPRKVTQVTLLSIAPLASAGGHRGERSPTDPPPRPRPHRPRRRPRQRTSGPRWAPSRSLRGPGVGAAGRRTTWTVTKCRCRGSAVIWTCWAQHADRRTSAAPRTCRSQTPAGHQSSAASPYSVERTRTIAGSRPRRLWTHAWASPVRTRCSITTHRTRRIIHRRNGPTAPNAIAAPTTASAADSAPTAPTSAHPSAADSATAPSSYRHRQSTELAIGREGEAHAARL